MAVFIVASDCGTLDDAVCPLINIQYDDCSSVSSPRAGSAIAASSATRRCHSADSRIIRFRGAPADQG